MMTTLLRAAQKKERGQESLALWTLSIETGVLAPSCTKETIATHVTEAVQNDIVST